MTLSPVEQRVVDDIERRQEELIALLADLIAFDTTAREAVNSPAHDEEALQT